MHDFDLALKNRDLSAAEVVMRGMDRDDCDYIFFSAAVAGLRLAVEREGLPVEKEEVAQAMREFEESMPLENVLGGFLVGLSAGLCE